MRNNSFSLEFFVAILIIIALVFDKCSDKKISQDKFDVTNKALQISQNKLGKETVRGDLYQDKYENLMAVDATKDSLLTRIQRNSDKNMEMAIAVNNQTSASHTGPTVVAFPSLKTNPDSSSIATVKEQPCDSVFPEYRYSEKTEFDSVSVVSNRNETIFNYVVYNNFDIKQSWKRKGIFGKQYYVEVTNQNPHTVTRDMRAFKLEKPKPKSGIWLLIGWVAGTATALAISNN